LFYQGSNIGTVSTNIIKIINQKKYYNINTFFGLFWVGFFRYMLGGSGPSTQDPHPPCRSGVPPTLFYQLLTFVSINLKKNIMSEKEMIMFDAIRIVNQELESNPISIGLIKLKESLHDFIEGYCNEE